MSSEKLAPAICIDTSVCQPNQTVSSTVTTKRNHQVYTQQIITSRVRKVDSATMGIEDVSSGSSPNSQSLVPVNDKNKSHVDIKRTTKTYCRRIIRKIGPNGEVSEEIIEEGDAIPSDFFSPVNAISRENSDLTDSSDNELVKHIMPGGAKFQASAAFNTVSESGEKKSIQMSTGPMEFGFGNGSSPLLSIEGNNERDDNDGASQQLALINNPSNTAVQQVLPDGTIVTRKFYGEKSATVTHSSTINGQTQTSSKSAFMSFSGESMLEAKSSINDMEIIFKDMIGAIQSNSFNVFNQFLSLNQNSMLDHMALAGGGMGAGLLSLEAPKHGSMKAIASPEVIHENIPSYQGSIAQQEEALIQQLIKSIKDSKVSNRLYWSNMEEVISSGILKHMKKEEIHLQEAIFEVITSEASYNISLDTLIEYYYNSELLNPNNHDSIINAVQKHHLFSNILLVKTVSLKLLKDLENRWSKQKPKLMDLADIILKHAQDSDFQQQYINYLTNQSYQINCLRSLLQKENFKHALITIQCNPQCCKLSLDSFLALPMQRLTRLKLLMEVILKLMRQSDDLFKKIPKNVVTNCQEALLKLKELLTTSENNKFKMEQKARLIDLSKILDFSGISKNIAIGSKELLKEGEVKANAAQIAPNYLKKLSKKRLPTFYLIVLSDLVIIAKKKSPTKLVVLDCCDKNKVDAFEGNQDINLSIKSSRSSLGSQTSISSQLSSNSADQTSQSAPGCSFVIKFNKENDSSSEMLVLTAVSADVREQWINAMKSNSS